MILVASFLASLLAGLALVALWRRLGRGDAARGDETRRKRQLLPVPDVGGLAIACGWCVLAATAWQQGGGPWTSVRASFVSDLPGLSSSEATLAAWSAVAALVVALGVGWVDDARAAGLPPLAKLGGAALCGVLLALPTWSRGTVPVALAWTAAYALAAILACSALNTFDNADGAAAGQSALGLGLLGSPLAVAVAAVWLLNLFVRRRPPEGESGRGDPLLYLGDAGSHLLGVAALVVPGAWPLLWLPFLDLVRVSLVRLGLGLLPWEGDRRHLAHRLQRLGCAPWAVVGVLLGVSAPALLWSRPAGFGLSLVLFLIAVGLTRRVAEEPAGVVR